MVQSNKHFLGTHAIVIGGSIAGLVAARILSDYFSNVTVLERGPRPDGPVARKSAPQTNHAHLLLGAANAEIERMYPGIIKELESAGALLVDSAADGALYHYTAWKPRFYAGFHTVGCSRPFLEWHLRRRTEAIPNIEIRYEQVAENLLTNAERTRVTGIEVRGAKPRLDADLIVDAAGRGTRAPRWLEELGYGKPFEQAVHVDLAYTSRLYERVENSAIDWKVLAVYASLPAQRGGFIFAIEGNRWIVSLPGYFKDHCPTDEQGFLNFAQSLPVVDLYEAIRNAKPLTDPVMHKIPSSRWFRYDQMKRLPEGYIMVGDSVVSLNPLYGQGMLVSIRGLTTVESLLAERARKRRGLNGLAPVVQRKIANAILPAWLLSTTMDLQSPKAVGHRPPGLGAVQRILARIIDLTNVDQEACRVFYDLLHMRRGPEAILDRRMLVPLVTQGLRRASVSTKFADSKPIPAHP